ncbi:MAG: class I SAM-dependent methyltransferase [Candidatus Micrarchaeota archaeon]|nr:class I SAM-dependent methyltransferase [Candidatus Micrarchaeota archaeon]
MSEAKVDQVWKRNRMVILNRLWKKEPEMVRTASIADFLDGKPPRSMTLDMGCGDTGKINIKLNHLYHGIDVSLVAIRAAKRKSPNANFLVADASYLPFRDNSFDRVASYSVIESLGVEFREAFRELVRVTNNEISFTTMHVDAIYKPNTSAENQYLKLSYATIHIETGLVGTTPEQMMGMLRDSEIEIDFRVIDNTGKETGINAVDYLNGLDDQSKKHIVLNAKKTIEQK